MRPNDPKCICPQPETRHEGNPAGHRGDCPRWGTTLPNTWRDRRDPIRFDTEEMMPFDGIDGDWP
jgi:hypothetical protein